jgi:hypothetical protein
MMMMMWEVWQKFVSVLGKLLRILHRKHLTRVVKEYTNYFNQERPHQGIGQRIPNFYDRPVSNPTGNISSRAILGGLHHSYFRVTDLHLFASASDN